MAIKINLLSNLKISAETLKKLPSICLAIKLDAKKETLIIGDIDSIQAFLKYKNETGILYYSISPLGSFFNLLDPNKQNFNRLDMIDNLNYLKCLISDVDIKKRDSLINQKFSEAFENINNPIYQYLYLKMFEIYKSLKNSENRLSFKMSGHSEPDLYAIYEKTEDLLLPFVSVPVNSLDFIIELNNLKQKNPLQPLTTDYYKYKTQNLYVSTSAGFEQFVVTDFSIMPIILHYLKYLYIDERKYFQKCKVCGKIFLISHQNKQLCSDKCIKIQNARNKEKHIAKKELAHKNDTKEAKKASSENIATSVKHTWYRKINKLKKTCTDESFLIFINEEFIKMKETMKKKKKALKKGHLPKTAFERWCHEQEELLKKLLQEHGYNI